MKTIKRERQVRLDELLKYVWDNDITEYQFESDNDSWVRVDEYGDVVSVYSIEKSDLFTITEEVEIDEDTPLNLVVVDGSIGELIWSKERGLVD
ncbi:hypothetical protein [Macrococcus animalis]|uniref:hypothetical protein n=1 Tax=Macrococcus animalis TaxID=3395467 RepID=UPI0039BE4366